MDTDSELAAPLPEVPSAERAFREVGDVTLHVVTAGDPADPLVVLLHGFPEFWYEWRAYVGPLVDAGYRVVVPDQRGYNRSEKPDRLAQYRLPTLTGDIVRLIDSEDAGSAHVVGHDWGATVAWDLALRYPEVLDRLGIVNVPHPTVFEATLKRNPRQLLKSWYVLYFQLPRLPEWGARRRNFEVLRATMQDEARPGAFSDAEMDRYRTAWDRQGALTAMFNWYRAIARYRDRPPRETVRAPTLVIWGEDDQALVPAMAPASVEHCEDGRLERFPDATHWVVHEYPDRVTDLLLGHLGS